MAKPLPSSRLKKAVTALTAAAALIGPAAQVSAGLDVLPRPPAIELLAYQKAYLADASRFKLAWWARGTRKTFTTTLEIVDHIMAVEAEGKRTRWIIASRGERQSLVAIEFAKQHAKAFALAVGDIQTEDKTTDQGFEYKVHTIRFPNGSEIIAVPANPDTLRGYTGNLLLDEFAFHLDSRKIWAAVFPIIRAEYLLRIASTGNGKGNKFYELATINDPVWSIHKVTIVDAVNAGLPFDLDEQRRALNDEDAWAQEYMLEWLDEASAWLDYDLINSCEAEGAGDPALYGQGMCYSGEDIGLRRDLWVMWVVEKVGDVLWTREIRTLRRAAFLEHDRTRDELFAKYRIIRHCMDQTGMGEKPVEDAKRRHGSLRVEGVLFSQASKLLLATVGKESFQDKKIRIPQGDDALRADLHKLKKEVTSTGAPRFVADSDSNGHADRAWACFLATYAASSTPTVYDFTPVHPNRGMDERDDDDKTFHRFNPYE